MLLPSLSALAGTVLRFSVGEAFATAYVWASAGCASGEVTESRLPLLQCTLEAQHRQARGQASMSPAWLSLWWHWLCPSLLQAQDVYTGGVISGLRTETIFTVIINPSGVVMWYLYPIGRLRTPLQ